jgi:hypothetical protein
MWRPEPRAFVVPAAGEKLHGGHAGYALTRIREGGDERRLKITKKH